MNLNHAQPQPAYHRLYGLRTRLVRNLWLLALLASLTAATTHPALALQRFTPPFTGTACATPGITHSFTGGHPNHFTYPRVAQKPQQPAVHQQARPNGHQPSRVLNLTCPPDVTIQCSDPVDLEDTGEPVITTDCPLPGDFTIDYEDIVDAGSCHIERTFTVINPCGEEDQCTQAITVLDAALPTFDVPAPVGTDQTLTCSGNIQPTVTGFPANLADNCHAGQPLASSGYTPGATSWMTSQGFMVAYVDAPSKPQPWPECSPTPDMQHLRKLELSRLWIVTDRCGNSQTAIQTIAIIDDEPPVWNEALPENLTVECDAIPTAPILTAQDACDGARPVSFLSSESAGPAPFIKTITRTWSTQDICGNSTSHIQTIRVQDTQQPIITCPPSMSLFTDGQGLSPEAIAYGIHADMVQGNCHIVLTGTAPLTEDNCEIVSQTWFIENMATGNAQGNGMFDGQPIFPFINIVTYTVLDGGGNSNTCSFTISVFDNEQPVITQCTQQVSPVTLFTDANCQAELPDYTGEITFEDNCLPQGSPVTVTQFPLPGTTLTGPDNDYLITFTAEDGFGNIQTCTITVHVEDNTPPVAACTDDFILVLSAQGLASLTPDQIDNGSTDNCGIADYQLSRSSFTCADAGDAILITLTVTDDVGLSDQCTMTITVKDPAAPVITNCPQMIMVGNDPDVCSAKVNWSPTQATDDCETASGIRFYFWTTGATLYGGADWPALIGNPNTPESQDDPLPGNGSGLQYAVGTTTVHIIAIDESMNVSAICAFEVVVIDTQLPVLTACPADRTVSTEADACFGLVPDLTAEMSANDNCPLEFTQDPVAGMPFGAAHGEVLTVTVTATDPGGHPLHCSVQLTLNDTQSPVITECPADRTVIAEPGTCESTVPDLLGELVAMDNCTFTTAQSPPAGTLFAGKHNDTQEVTILVTDGAGLTDACTVILTLVDQEDPVIANCPQDQTVNANNGCTYQLPNYFTTLDYSDNCTEKADLTTLQQPLAGSVFGNKQGGSQTVQLTVVDEAGNQSSCSFVLTLNPTPTPGVNFTALTYCAGEPVIPIVATTPIPDASFLWFAQPGNIPVPASQLSGAFNQIYTPLSNAGVQTVTVQAVYPGSTCLSDPVTVTTTILSCQISITDPCGCKNNATTLDNGQFDEAIALTAPSGQTWFVQSNSGLFQSASPAPPAAPLLISIGTTLTETVLGGGLSLYTLQGIHVDAQGYQLTLSNTEVTRAISNRCFYPNPAISGVFDNYCVNYPPVTLVGSATYPPVPPASQPFPAAQQSARFDLLNSLGQIVQANITVLNPAGIIPGNYTLRYTFDAQDNVPSAAYPGCAQALNHALQIFQQPPLSLNCNNKSNVSLGTDGTATITADDILEGSYGCYDQYLVAITGKQSNVVNCSDVGKTFEVKVTDPITGNSCWGMILVEDKMGPTIQCSNVTTSCNNEALTPGAIGFPVVTDNCGPGNIELTHSQITQNLTCDPLYDEIIERIWYAKDKNNGITASCIQEIRLRKSPLSEVVFPANRDDISLPALTCSSADTTPANTGRPMIDQLPIGGYCEMAITYKDKILPICTGSYKIVRSWMVMETCTNGMISHDQIIIVSDKQGPAITCPNTQQIVIVNPAWNGCGARIFTPTINVTDDCTFPSGIAMQTSILAGGVLQQLPTNGGFFNVPYGHHTITYKATDQCGNVSTCSLQIQLEDTAPPTAVCNDHIVVSLIDEVTHIFAQTFDDGSHDNCSPKVDFLVRRMDNALCPGDDATDFGPSVPFYCCDVTNGPVMVVLKVYVDKNHNGQQDANEPYNECMLSVTVQDKLKPVIQCPADITLACLEDLQPQDPAMLTKIKTPNTPISGAYAFTYRDSVEIVGLPSNTRILNLNLLLDIDHEVVDQLLIKVKSPAGTELVLFNGGACGIGKKDIQATFSDQGNPFFCNGHPKAISGIVKPQGAILALVNGENPNGQWIFEITDKAPVGGGLIKSIGVELTTGTPLSQMPTAMDNASGCGLTFEFTDLDQKLQCANGQTIRRLWQVSDASGNTAACTQRISLADSSPLIVDFPEDVTITDCTLPGSLNATGEPIHTGDCEVVAISSVDEILHIVPGACYKIVRTWTVVDWCKFDHTKSFTNGGIVLDPFQNLWQDDGDGFFKYVQNIKVIDNDKPVLDCPGNLVFNSLSANCNAHEVTITLPASDGCTPQGQLKSNWTIDLMNNGSIDLNGTGLTVTREVPLGTHRIQFQVTDGCGNFSHCSFLFTVIDAKKPTPMCITGISTDLMPTTGEVMVSAETFEAKTSNDNCTPYSGLKFLIERFSTMDFSNPIPDGDAQPVLTFNCDDYKDGITFVALWVGDAGFDLNGDGIIQDDERNWDYCVTYIEVQNNMGFPCPNTVTGTIYGNVKTELGKDVEDVKLSLSGGGAQTMSTQTGWFHFPTLPQGSSYVVVPEKEDHALNGVSTYDLLLIQKHLLGAKPITSPYSLIAADVNKTGTISVSDIIALRKTLLSAGSQFPDNTSWRFVDEEFDFPVPSNPWATPFPETVALPPLQGPIAINLIGIKIGDVSGDAVTTSLQEAETRQLRETVRLHTEEQVLEPGEYIEVPFYLTDSRDIEGFQFTLSFDPALEFLGFDAANLREEHLGFRFVEDGLIAVSWNGRWDDQLPAFTLRFRTRDEGLLSHMVYLHSTILQAEAYLKKGQSFELAGLGLDFQRTETQDDGLALYQNIPNPFNGHTLIGFNLPTEGQAILVFHDVSGREVRRLLGHYPAGFHQVELLASDLPGAGMYYYTLQFKGRQLTRRMSLLK